MKNLESMDKTTADDGGKIDENNDTQKNMMTFSPKM